LAKRSSNVGALGSADVVHAIGRPDQQREGDGLAGYGI
jgi:hypothetical protein